MLREYPSKIMLAGEYAVIVGGSALTIPFRGYRAIVRSVNDIPPGKEKLAQQSLDYLQKIYAYIQNIPAANFHASPDLEFFADSMQKFWLDLDIPIGYGLGSSGAVSAAIYDLYFPGSDNLALAHQKEDLALIESFFHGKSSGVDALTCHAGVALRFHSTGGIEPSGFDPATIPGNYCFFLLNSQERFDTGPLVKHFLERIKAADYKRAMEDEYLPLNQIFIESLLGENELDPALLVKTISEFQLQYFPEMIPENALELWSEGLANGEYYMKLNGSGGGMMLGITHNSSKEKIEARWKQEVIWIG